MEQSSRLRQFLFAAGIGFISGALFTWIVGDLDAAHYVVELLSIGPLEIPFIVAGAVLVRRSLWGTGLAYALVGTVASLLMSFPEKSITPIVFLKIAAMGVIIGEARLFSRSFTGKLSAASVPGFILACVFGLQLIIAGVSSETISEIRQEALDMYQAFMSRDNAVNAVENAMGLFNGFFRLGIGIISLSSLILSWLAFHVTRFVLARMKIESEEIPPLHAFAVPFHAIWLFLIGLALYLIDYQPIHPIAVNVVFVMAGLYGIQGLAVVTYHMKRISFGFWPRIIFWLIIFITLTFSVFILLITGILDNWIDLRSLPLPNDKGVPEEEEKDNEGDS